MAVIFLSHCLQ